MNAIAQIPRDLSECWKLRYKSVNRDSSDALRPVSECWKIQFKSINSGNSDPSRPVKMMIIRIQISQLWQLRCLKTCQNAYNRIIIALIVITQMPRDLTESWTVLNIYQSVVIIQVPRDLSECLKSRYKSVNCDDSDPLRLSIML